MTQAIRLLFNVENLRIRVERLIRQILGPVVRFLVRLQVSPNTVSVTGFLVTIVAVGLFVGGAPVVAGLIFLLGSLFDVLDGELARVSNRVTPFGAVIDSLLDRISEGALLIAIAWYFADRGEVAGVVITVDGNAGIGVYELRACSGRSSWHDLYCRLDYPPRTNHHPDSGDDF